MRGGYEKLGMVLALVACAGCGGGSSGGGGGVGSFNTSVSGSKPLASLSAADKTQLCKDINTYFMSPAVISAECKLAGVLAAALTAAFDDTATDAMLQATCTQGINSCKSGGADAGAGGMGNGSMDVCNSTNNVMGTCTATVAEFSACAQDIPKAFDAVPACSTITRASLNSDAGSAPTGMPQTTACTTLQTKCPGIFN